MFIDSHCHLYMAEYDDDREETISRAKQAGVDKVILPGVDIPSFRLMLRDFNDHPEFFRLAAGIHPNDVEEYFDPQIRAVERFIQSAPDDAIVAVGEIGLDFYHNDIPPKRQEQTFRLQLDIARRYNLPVIIHSREALDQTLDVMQDYKDVPAVFHCFGGSPDDVDKIRSRYNPEAIFGIGGVLTFKNSKLRDTIPSIGLDNIILETDAPWLAPTPNRGKRNEPALLTNVIQTLADVLQTTPQDVEEKTLQTTRRLFRI